MQSENESMLEPEHITKLVKYEEELISLQHKSQDLFEQQLSYISAGCLVLSIGFVKDIVKNVKLADLRPLLIAGWILMIVTLLVNLISHLFNVYLYDKSISDVRKSITRKSNFDADRTDNRFKIIKKMNWLCIFTLIIGILLVVVFIYFNM